MKRSIVALCLLWILAGVATARPPTTPPRVQQKPRRPLVAKNKKATTQQQQQQQQGGNASMTAMIFNLVNNVAGAGILSLSAGQAKGTGWIPSIGISTALGLLSARTFVMVGEACDWLEEGDFKGLWARTMGPSTTWVVDTLIAVLCVAVCIIYAGVLGDVFTPLLAQAGLPDRYNSRSSNMWILTLTCLLPMSLLKNLSALAFTSILGFCAIMYTVFFINVRALDGSYTLGSGKFATDGVLDVLPSFTKTSWWNIDFSSLVLVSNLGLAYVAHYNSPSMYRELKDTNASRFGKMVNIGFSILIFLYVITMCAGYATFGDTTLGNILLNYHPSDRLALLGQVATGFSILFGFPLVAAGARESLVGALSNVLPNLADYHALLVVTLLTVVTGVAVVARDISLVMGLTGASLGSFICYVCPALVYDRAVALRYGGTDSAEYRRRTVLAKALVPFGVILGALGCWMTLQSA